MTGNRQKKHTKNKLIGHERCTHAVTKSITLIVHPTYFHLTKTTCPGSGVDFCLASTPAANITIPIPPKLVSGEVTGMRWVETVDAVEEQMLVD